MSAPVSCLIIIACGLANAVASEAPQRVAVGRLVSPPVLDGRLADWPADATTILLGEAAHTMPRPAKWGGAKDLSGAVWLAWDDGHLYLAADVVDDKPLQAAPTGGEPWQGDSIEVFFNATPGEQRRGGFRQIGLVPPLAEGAGLVALCPQGDVAGVRGAALSRENGYTLEVAIPWSVVEGFTPGDGRTLGFQIMLNDRDSKGRKSQLCWYPSAITYAHPLDMNVLRLATDGAGMVGPPLLAGPNAAAVTTPGKAALSVIAQVAGATAVRMSLGEAEPLTLPLETSGERLSVAAGVFPTGEREDGPADFTVEALSADGVVLATGAFRTELAGRRNAAMREQLNAAQERLKSDEFARADPEALAGVGFWLGRINALAANEARPESVRADMLDRMLVELTDIAGALDRLARGDDPYAGRTGSFVRAYRSPLTGEFRPHSLFVPRAGDRPDEGVPLIVMLHGIFGDDRHLFQRLDSVSGLGAIVYQAASYRQFDWSDVSAAETWTGLEQVLATQPVDRERVYLIGHHIGGRGVLQLAMDRPDFFTALAPLLPGVDARPPYAALRLYPEFYDEAAAGNLIPFPVYRQPPPPAPVVDPVERAIMERLSLVTRAENIAGLPMRMVRGEAQPDAGAERLALLRRLRELGDDAPVRHEIGAQHGSTPPELGDPDFYQWLLAQRRVVRNTRTFVVTDLRDNVAWGVRVDALTDPLKPGRVTVSENRVTTDGVRALTLLETRLFDVDGQAFLFDGRLSLVRSVDGHWRAGVPRAGTKRHGLSGPIDDFQFDRFLYVHGSADPGMEKIARKLANRGLGAEFAVKSDLEVTADDIAGKHLVLVGTPRDNAVLARIADHLPFVWREDGGVGVGDASALGTGAGLCAIYPNPESPDRYVVVISAQNAQDYGKVWNERAGVDYVLVAGGDDGVSRVLTRGVFDNNWQPDAALRTAVAAP